jgi:Tfp pilus assembly protein PilO
MKPDLNKILEQFNKMNDQTRYGILGGVVFFIILLDVLLLVLPQIGAIGSTNDQVRQMTADTLQVQTDKQRINQLRKNLQDSRLQLSALSARVRPVQEVPSILTTISSIANEYGVKIEQLDPEKGQQETLKAASADKYYALPVLIKARCGYHMFGRFLNKLEGEDMFFIMKDFIIQNDGANTNSHLFSLTLDIILVEKH